MNTKPTITKAGLLDVQACIPKTWSNDEIVKFVEKEYPCGTQYGWHIRKQGDERLVLEMAEAFYWPRTTVTCLQTCLSWQAS